MGHNNVCLKNLCNSDFIISNVCVCVRVQEEGVDVMNRETAHER